MAGSFKVLYSHFRTVRQVSKDEQVEHGALSGSAIQGVSFGSRALQSGIEVEGVWISQSHTVDSPRRGQTTNPRSNSAIDLPQARSPQDLRPQAVHPAMRDQSQRGRQRSDYVPYVLRTSEPRQVLDELDAVYRTPRWYREESPASLVDDDAVARPPSIPPRSPRRMDKPSALPQHTDLTMLDRHRRAQVAETGQLTARAKKHNLTLDTSAQSGSPRSRKSAPVGPRTEVLPASSRPAKNKPKELVVPARSASLPDVISFKQFMASTGPPSPSSSSSFSEIEQREISKLLDYAYGNEPRSAREKGMYELEDTSPQRETRHIPATELGGKSAEQDTRNSRGVSRGPSVDSAQKKNSQEDRSCRSSFEKLGVRRDQVLRGHDSGFEILRPGTLNDNGPSEGRPQNGPPISLHKYARSRDESRGRKLQKKRRSSVGSQTSVGSTSTSGRRLSFRGLLDRFTDSGS